MTPAALNREQAARYVGLRPDEFVAEIKARALPRPRLLIDNTALWLPDDLHDALKVLPYADGTRSEFVPERRIYFIGGKSASVVKIGIANNVEARVREFQTGSPERLFIYATVKGHLRQEQHFHRILAPWRDHGEWFRADQWFEEVRHGVLHGADAQSLLKRLEAMQP